MFPVKDICPPHPPTKNLLNLNFIIFDISHDAVLETLYLGRREGVGFGYYRHYIHFPVHAPHELQVDLAKPATAKQNHGWYSNWQIQHVQERLEMCTEFLVRKLLGREGDLRVILRCILLKHVNSNRWEVPWCRDCVLNSRSCHQRFNKTERIIRTFHVACSTYERDYKGMHMKRACINSNILICLFFCFFLVVL